MESQMQQVEEKPAEAFVGGCFEASESEVPTSMDAVSSYPHSVQSEVKEAKAEPASNAAEPASEPAIEAEAATLPPVPEGVVATVKRLEESSNVAEEVPVLRFLGSSMGPEFDFVSPEEGVATFGEVMIQLVDAALEGLEDSADPLTGERVAQIFCRGDVEDERVAFLLLLLAQNRPITGELVLAALRAQGQEDLVEGAILAREELVRVGDVAVEQLEASTGSFQPLGEEGTGLRAPGSDSGDVEGPGSSSEPQAPGPQPRALSSSSAEVLA